MDIYELKKKNVDFQKRWLEEDPDFFERLEKGQDPDFFVLACSDSRVCPTTITEMPPGHMFIHRNIANQVIENDKGFASSLYYALVYLKVKYILVKGHTNCGGVHAAWDGVDDEHLQEWLSHVRQSLPNEIDADEAWTTEKLTKYNVFSQVTKLENHPIYKEYGEGVQIIGMLFHLKSGELEIFDSESLSEEGQDIVK